MFKTFFENMKAKRMAKALRKFSLNYVNRYGINKERDLALLNEIIQAQTEKFNLEISIIMNSRPKGEYIHGKIADEDISILVSNVVDMLSSVYIDILMVYFGNMDNLINFIVLQFRHVEYNILGTNKLRFDAMKQR